VTSSVGVGPCGCTDPSGKVWGSYLHGIFDSDLFRRWLINRWRTAKGLPSFSGQGAHYDLKPALDQLAEVLRWNLDMKAIYRLLGV
jgi:cobyric acid synthase